MLRLLIHIIIGEGIKKTPYQAGQVCKMDQDFVSENDMFDIVPIIFDSLTIIEMKPGISGW